MKSLRKSAFFFTKFHIKSPLSSVFSKKSFSTVKESPQFTQIPLPPNNKDQESKEKIKPDSPSPPPNENYEKVNTIRKLFSVQESDPTSELPLALKQRINVSTYVENVLTIYKINQGIFNEKNILFLIKRISKLFSKLMDDIKTLSQNSLMIEFLHVVKIMIPFMNAETLIQTLIFFRKMTDRKYFSEHLGRQDFDELINRFTILIKNQEMNFNNACLFYYETSYLRLTTAAPFKFIDEVLRIKDAIVNVNAYYLTILMKALHLNKDFKKSEIFWKNLLYMINYQTDNLRDVNLLAQFFNFLMELDAQDKISKNLEMKMIMKDSCSKLMNIFNENTKLLLNFDLLNILNGYTIAPLWVDRALLETIKAVIIENFEKTSYYDIDFRLKFLFLMSQSKPLDQLNEATSEKLLEILLNYLLSNNVKNFSIYYQVTKSISAYKSPKKLLIYKFVSKQMLTLNLNFTNTLSYLLILKKFLDDGFECEKEVKDIAEFYKEIMKSSFLERISLVWDVAFHKNIQDKIYVRDLQTSILKIFLEKVEKKTVIVFKVIDIFGDRLKQIGENPMIQEFLKKIEEKVLPFEKEFSYYENAKLELFFNSDVIEQNSLFEVLRKGKFSEKKLKSHELEALLKFFRTKQVKSVENFELLIKVINKVDSKSVRNNINLLIQVITELPSHIFLIHAGNILLILKSLFEKLPKDLDFKEIGLSYQALLDLSDFCVKNAIYDIYYHGLLLAKEILKNKLIEEVSLFKLSEIGSVIALAMNRNQIRNMLKEDYLILIEALRKIADFLEVTVVENEHVQDNHKNDKLQIYKNCVFLNGFLKIYYKAFLLDLKKKDPLFASYGFGKVNIFFFLIF